MKAPRVLLLILAALLLACVSPAQTMTSGSSETRNGVSTLKMTLSATSSFGQIPPITGASYSAEEVSEHTQTLADGTHIVQPGRPHRLMFRDSQGRTRIEQDMMHGPNGEPGVKIVEIRDPVAGYQYTLDTANKVAHRLKSPAARPVPAEHAGTGFGIGSARGGGSGSRSSAAATTTVAPERKPPEMSNESLGTQMIEGVMAEGRKTTMTFPVGSQGNDRPIVVTSENWVSPDLHLTVMSRHNDPRNGESVTKLINVSRSEPDPQLFQAPADYKVVDEEGSFTIEVTRPGQR
jgi:hypothetical protein